MKRLLLFIITMSIISSCGIDNDPKLEEEKKILCDPSQFGIEFNEKRIELGLYPIPEYMFLRTSEDDCCVWVHPNGDSLKNKKIPYYNHKTTAIDNCKKEVDSFHGGETYLAYSGYDQMETGWDVDRLPVSEHKEILVVKYDFETKNFSCYICDSPTPDIPIEYEGSSSYISKNTADEILKEWGLWDGIYAEWE